jgi:hypothetical protein
MAIFADPGAGKTTLLHTAPRSTLVVNIDNSVSSLPRAEDILIYPDPSEKRPVSSWKELDAVVSNLETGWLEELGVKTVAFDTITEGGILLQKDILSRPSTGGKRLAETSLTQAEYGIQGEEMLAFLRRLRNLSTKANIVVTCQTKDLTVDKPEGGVEMYRFASFGPGQMASEQAPQLFDVVGYLGVELRDRTLVRKMLFQPVNNRRAKIRTKPGTEAPIVMENPNLSTIFKLVNGK